MANQETLSRRGILRLGSLLGAGASAGLLLPWGGGKVVALTSAEAAADIPAVLKPFPTSKAFDGFMNKAHALEHIKRHPELDDAQHRHTDRSLHYRTAVEMGDAAIRVAARPAQTWGDIVELAQIAYVAAPKEEIWDQHLFNSPHFYTGRLWNHASPSRPELQIQSKQRWLRQHDWYTFANAALIEGVLHLAGRQGYDPSIAAERNS